MFVRREHSRVPYPDQYLFLTTICNTIILDSLETFLNSVSGTAEGETGLITRIL